MSYLGQNNRFARTIDFGPLILIYYAYSEAHHRTHPPAVGEGDRKERKTEMDVGLVLLNVLFSDKARS